MAKKKAVKKTTKKKVTKKAPQKTASKVEIGWPQERPEVEYDDGGWLCADTKKNLLRAINKDTKNIVEIGSWLGKSARFLHENSNAVVYCLDHWKGSVEHQHVKHAHKLPLLWETFCYNNWTYQDRMIPVKGNGQDGLEWLFRNGIDVDVFYVDGSHEYSDVKADILKIAKYWPEASIVGDDYVWTGVHQAVHDCTEILNRRLYVQGSKSWAFFAEGV